MDKVIYKELSYKLNGVLYKVHNQIRRFSSEREVCDAIEYLLKKENIQYQRECSIIDKEKQTIYSRIDFIIENKIILEIKYKRFLHREDYWQIKRYLKESNMKLGILINFRTKWLYPKRILNRE